MSSARRQFLRPLHSLGMVLLMIMPLAASAADLYRWTDARGITHYSDKPPKGVSAERVKKKAPRNLGSVEATDEADAAGDPDAERCKVERDRLNTLQSNRRVQMEGRDGSLRELSAEEIRLEIEFSQRAIARLCKAPETE